MYGILKHYHWHANEGLEVGPGMESEEVPSEMFVLFGCEVSNVNRRARGATIAKNLAIKLHSHHGNMPLVCWAG